MSAELDNLIRFPRPQSPRPPALEPGHIRRAEALRLARDKTPSLSASDRESAAGNLHRLLEELRSQSGLSPARIAREAGLGGNGHTDSSKRLHTYTLPPEASEARRDRLSVKATRYFDIASAVARLSGLMEEQLLCRIFEGCSFGVAAATIPDWEQERWSVLTRMLTEMSRAIIHDTDLQGFWRQLGMMQFPYDFETQTFGMGRYSFDHYAVRTGLSDSCICREDAPPIPSVPLARRLMAEPCPVVLHLADGRRLPAAFYFHLVIGLALGPIHGPDDIGPLLQLRSEVEIMTGDGRSIPQDPPFQSRFSPLPRLMIEDTWVQVVDIDGFQEPEPEGRDGGEHHYLGHFEISPALLRKYLAEDDFSLLPERPIPMDTRFPLRFGHGSMGAWLQHDLLDGSLERDLAEVCRSLHEALKLYQDHSRIASLQAEAQAFNRWHRPDTKKEDKA